MLPISFLHGIFCHFMKERKLLNNRNKISHVDMLFKLFCVATAAFVSTLCDLTPFQQEIKRFLPTRKLINSGLKTYFDDEISRLQKLKEIYSKHLHLTEAAVKNETTFLSNPLSVYLLLKSLTSDFYVLSELMEMKNSSLIKFYQSLNSSSFEFPSDEDLIQATNSFSWYQAMKGDENKIEKMILPGFPFTAEDCLELGFKAHSIANYNGVVFWMEKGLKLLGENKVNTTVGWNCMEYLAYAYTMEGRLVDSLNLSRALFHLRPNNTRAKANIEYLEERLASGHKEENLKGDNQIVDYDGFLEDLSDYRKLCRGETTQSQKTQSKLTCRYVTNENPYLLLHPAKEEELYLDPRIVVYHNWISDQEIEMLKSLALPKLEQGDVSKDPGDVVVEVRISKVGWLKDEEHTVVSRISQRVQEITGLSMESAEEFQIANYGVGGFYRLHPDFLSDQEVEEAVEKDGNRIATWLSYINDVEEGGFTVFPMLGVIVKPEKGSAAFWYNLHKNGTGNIMTVHAGCPVLGGTKWIANKWIHEVGQEQKKPCSLRRDE